MLHKMDSIMTNTENLSIDMRPQDVNILLDIIKDLCSEDKLSSGLKGRVNRIIADCDMTYHSSLHKLSTPDQSSSVVLGLHTQIASELTFDEQLELNQAIIDKVDTKIPKLTDELAKLKQRADNSEECKEKIKNFQDSIDEKINKLQEQEEENVTLMVEWLNHKVEEMNRFSNCSTELLNRKTRLLELKSKILHLHILKSIFTETNQSIQAYSEVHKDLKETIKETEERIKHFQDIVNGDH